MLALAPSTPLSADVRHGQTLDYDGLRDEAAAAVEASGRRQVDLAAELDVTQPTLSRALKEPGPRYAALQRRLIGLLTRYAVDDAPLFRVRRQDG